MRELAAEITVVASGTADAQGLAALVGRVLVGYAVTESAATPAAAAVTLRHGTLATDDEIAWIDLAANGVEKFTFPDGGIHVSDGVFVDRTAGTTTLSLWHVTV